MTRDDRSATRVTGVSSELRSAARLGEVLAKRYRVVAPVARHVVGRAYHAADTETGQRILLHVVDRGLLPTSDATERYIETLRSHLKIQHAYLPGLRDVGMSGHRVYVAEPYPTGLALRDFVSHRRQQSSRLGLGEMHAVVDRLQSALDVLPRDSRHGFIDASTIWVQLDGIQLSTPFVVSALENDAVAQVLEEHPSASGFAPEVRAGTPHGTSDLYSVAHVMAEALLGVAPDPGATALPGPRLAVNALTALLTERPDDRPRSLRPLLEALASHLVEAPAPPSRVLPRTRTEPYAAMLEEEEEEEVDLPRTRTTPLATAAAPTTTATTAPSLDRPSLHSAGKEADSAEPEVPRTPTKKISRQPDRTQKRRRGTTEELDLRDLEPVDPIPVHRIAANLNAWTGAATRSEKWVRSSHPPFSEITSVGRRPVRPPPIRPRRPIPVPPPRVDPRVFTVATQYPGHRVTATGAAAALEPASWPYTPTFAGLPAWPDVAPWMADADEDTSEGRRHSNHLPSWLRSWMIVVLAMVSGALIIAGGLWMQNEKRRAERERHLEQRYEELRRSGQVHTPEAPPVAEEVP